MRAAPVSAVIMLAATVGLSGCGGSSRPRTAADFCGLAKAQETQTATFNSDFTTDKPGQLKPVVEKALAQLNQFDEAAPSAIASAVHTYVTDEKAFLTVIKSNGYDVTKAAGSLTRAVSDPAFMKASQQLSTYLVSTCHLGPPPSATPTTGG